jgi:hypothetical protein
VTALLTNAVSFLRATWSADLGLFPFSTLLVDGEYRNDYRRPLAFRYTINTLLGLQQAAVPAGIAAEEELRDMTNAFLARRFDDVESPADHGLLMVLLRGEHQRQEAAKAFAHVKRLANRDLDSSLNVQDLAWMLWGASSWATSGVVGAREVAHALYQRLVEAFVDPATGLARHSTRRYRRRMVSFGSTVYALRALHEYAVASGDEEAKQRFLSGVERVIEFQGPRGEWPWLFDTHGGFVREIYPVYAVHQDSMAMLFLLPALDAGLRGASSAIRRSLPWGFGVNELGVDMYPESPRFMAYRAIERRDPLPRLARYLRFAARTFSARSAEFARPASLRVNPECRSYHLGWLLYAWSGRVGLLTEILSERQRFVPASGA